MSGRRGKYFCAQICGGLQHKDINKTKIGLFRFPDEFKHEEVYRSWCQEKSICKHNDIKDITLEQRHFIETTCVC